MKSSSEKDNQLNSPNLKVTDNNEIIGNWTMCATSKNGLMTQMNICAIIAFNNNGTGHVERNSVVSETFAWKFKNSGLIIYGNRNSEFPDTFYYAKITERDNQLDLILNHYDNSYFLSK